MRRLEAARLQPQQSVTLNEIKAVKNSMSQIYYWLRQNNMVTPAVSAELGAIFAVLDDKETELQNESRNRS